MIKKVFFCLFIMVTISCMQNQEGSDASNMKPVDYVLKYVKSEYPEAEILGQGSYKVPLITEKYPCILIKYIDLKGKNVYGQYVEYRIYGFYNNSNKEVIPELLQSKCNSQNIYYNLIILLQI